MYHFFDESGDTGFKFLAGSSAYWIGAMVSTNNPQTLQERISALKAELGVSAHFEFRFHDVNRQAKERFFAAILSQQFDVRAIVVDKRTLSQSFRQMSKQAFYCHFITELVLRAPDEEIQDDILVIDGSVKILTRALRVHLSRATRERGMGRKFKKIVTKDSRQNNALQCADMIVGAIARMVKHDDRSYYEAFEDKIRDLWLYGGDEQAGT